MSFSLRTSTATATTTKADPKADAKHERAQNPAAAVAVLAREAGVPFQPTAATAIAPRRPDSFPSLLRHIRVAQRHSG